MDRDEGSVLPSDYKRACSLCLKEKISLCVSNPRFEFWLLLHFLSREKMNLEEVENPHSIYLENSLGEELKKRGFTRGYAKNSYNAEAFAERSQILQAIQNESVFCEDTEKLLDETGSNLGLMMKKLFEGS